MTNSKNRSAVSPLSAERAEKLDRSAAGYSRPPLARMMRLHELLMADQFPNCRQVAEEFEVAAKTVQRDVNFMRDRLGLPIEYEKARFGFRYTRPVSNFPALAGDGARAAASPWKRTLPAPIGSRPALNVAVKEDVAMRIGFDSESSKTVRGRIWHPTQSIRSLPGGGVELSIRIRDEWEIIRWVLSWGAHAWIIEPAQVRDRVREIVREILARY